MKATLRSGVFFVAALLALAVPAAAQITAAPVTNLPSGNAHRNNVAFDPVHEVYLVIVRRPPVSGRFLDKNGAPIGPEFVIAQEPGDPFTAWPSVAFGGPPNDPTFLVTYLVADLDLNPKYGRLVRFVPGGQPTVSGPSWITNVVDEWQFSEKGQNHWVGDKFVMGTRVMPPGSTLPTPQLNFFNMDGSVSAPVNLGDGADYYGSPAISCSGGGVCLALGFKAGVATNFSGGTYARLFESASLTPLGSLFALSNFGPNEDQSAVFVPHTGLFLTQWFRGGGAGYIDTRLVSPNGDLGPLDFSLGIGPEAGGNTMAFNQSTLTTLLVTKGAGAALNVWELGDDGRPIRPNNVITLTNWDGLVLDYLPSIGANANDGQWLITFELASGGFFRIVQGTEISTSSLPPTVLNSATLPVATEDTPYTQFLVANGNAPPYVWAIVGGTLPPGMWLNGSSLTGTPTTPGTFQFRVRVTGADSQAGEKDLTLVVNSVIVVPPGGPTGGITLGTQFGLAPGNAYRNNVAFDPINEVYLVIVKRPPVTGRFLNKFGQQIGQDFLIATEPGEPFTAWASVAFGGPPNDPTFLVTYTLGDLDLNPKYGRLVRFVPGSSPSVGEARKITDVRTEWLFSEKAQNLWNGEKFIVGTRVKPAGASLPTPQVNLFDMNGNVSAPVILGDGADYYGSPAIACVPNGTCLTIGFMAGIATGYSGGTYARRFDGLTLAPLAPLFPLAAGLPNEDHGVVYQTHTGRFLAQWFRGGGPGYIDTRLVAPDGTMSALNLSRGIGPGAGTNALSYNPSTRTSLLVTKNSEASLLVMELGDDGYPVNPGNALLITPWDGLVLDYLPSIAANPNSSNWLLTAELQAYGFATIIQGTPAVGTNSAQNGDFSNGMTGWQLFGAPGAADVFGGVNGGVLEFYRAQAAPGTPNQAVVLQPLGVPVAANAPIAAQFDLGNSSSVRKRMTVVFHDTDFSDLQFCSFWLAPGAPMRTYVMRTHTTEAWSNATLSFYAASEGSFGGHYRLDNVVAVMNPSHATGRTECVDPTAPPATSDPDGPELIVNGGFDNLFAGWTQFGQITAEVNAGVAQFIRPTGTPAGALLTLTDAAVPSDMPLTGTFSLGNSSAVRKRVTAIVHDADFTDLMACSYWLAPGQPLTAYTIRGFTTEAWTNATISFYLANVDTEPWAQLDNVSLKQTPGVSVWGTQCVTGGTTPPEAPAGASMSVVGEAGGSAVGSAVRTPTGSAQRSRASVPFVMEDWAASGSFEPSVGADGESYWKSVAPPGTVSWLRWGQVVDLRDATSAWLQFSSVRSGPTGGALVEVSTDGAAWRSVGAVPASDDWREVLIDLGEYLGQVVVIRFVHGADAVDRSTWLLGGLQVHVKAPALQLASVRPQTW